MVGSRRYHWSCIWIHLHFVVITNILFTCFYVVLTFSQPAKPVLYIMYRQCELMVSCHFEEWLIASNQLIFNETRSSTMFTIVLIYSGRWNFRLITISGKVSLRCSCLPGRCRKWIILLSGIKWKDWDLF